MKPLDTLIKVENDEVEVFEGPFSTYIWEQLQQENSPGNLESLLENNMRILDDDTDSFEFKIYNLGDWKITDVQPINDTRLELISLLRKEIEIMKKTIGITNRQVVIDVLEEEIEEKEDKIKKINNIGA